jgi:hypothetical protein
MPPGDSLFIPEGKVRNGILQDARLRSSKGWQNQNILDVWQVFIRRIEGDQLKVQGRGRKLKGLRPRSVL